VPSTSNARKILDFVPPRSANSCIGTTRERNYFLITSTCSRPVLAVTKGDRAGVAVYEGYFLADHYLGDPDRIDNRTLHYGEVETTSCFKGDRFCTIEWLETLQHCKVWRPAPSLSSYQYFGATRSYPLDCAPDAASRTPNSLWNEFNRDLYSGWTKILDKNLSGKKGPTDEGATQCAVDTFVPIVQFRLDTMYRHQQMRKLPQSTCDESVFGVRQ
jgi:hypothetical protein